MINIIKYLNSNQYKNILILIFSKIIIKKKSYKIFWEKRISSHSSSSIKNITQILTTEENNWYKIKI